VSSALRVGVLTDGGDSSSSADVRRALARELHDRVAQTLTAMLIDLENFKMDQLGNQSVLREIAALQESTRDALKNLRGVLYDLRGQSDIDENFTKAVCALVGRFRDKTRLTVTLSVAPSWPSELPPQAALNLYRIIEEALTNVRLHSAATLVEVALGLAFDNQLAVEVKDDGRGADTEAGRSVPGLGLIGMRERASILGGRVEVERVLGRGTTVRAILPRKQLL
jgi:signal transduction histidine kinase